MAWLGASVPPPPLNVPPPASVYRNLPPDLARMYAALPPLQPTRQASVAPQLAPPFVPLPVLAPAPVTHYQHLPSDFAQQLAALPPLIPQSRGRGRGNNATVSAPAPACLTYAQIVARYDALQPVCIFDLPDYLKLINSLLRSFHHHNLHLHLHPLHLHLLLCCLENLQINMLLFNLYVIF